MNTPHDLEDAVRDRFEHAMSDTTAPVDTLRTNAMARGRRLRRRRQSFAAAGAVAAIAATGFGVQYAAGGTDAREANDFTSDSSAPAKKKPTTAPTVATDGWWTMSASEMVERLKPLLPSGARVVDPLIREPGASEENTGFLTSGLSTPSSGGDGGFNMIFYDGDQRSKSVIHDPDKPGEPQTMYMASSPSFEQQVDCTWLLSQNNGSATCDQLTGPHGERAVFVKDADNAVDFVEFRMLRKDGSMIYVSASNSDQEKWNEPTSEAIPLTPAQVRAIGESDVWYD